VDYSGRQKRVDVVVQTDVKSAGEVIRRVDQIKERGFPGAGCCGSTNTKRAERECFEGESDRGGRAGRSQKERASGL
jgi:hypothetical protein